MAHLCRFYDHRYGESQEGALERDGGVFKSEGFSARREQAEHDDLGGSLTEAELIAAAIAGGQDAFTAIYQQNKGVVAAIARRMLKDRNQVDDLVQDVFVKVFKGLSTFNSRSTLKTWVARIALRECLIVIRRERTAHRGGKFAIVPIEQPSEDGTMVDWLGREDPAIADMALRLDLERFLRHVPAGDQTVLRLVFEGMCDREVGERLGFTTRQAQGKVLRAKRRARVRGGSLGRFIRLAY